MSIIYYLSRVDSDMLLSIWTLFPCSELKKQNYNYQPPWVLLCVNDLCKGIFIITTTIQSHATCHLSLKNLQIYHNGRFTGDLQIHHVTIDVACRTRMVVVLRQMDHVGRSTN